MIWSDSIRGYYLALVFAAIVPMLLSALVLQGIILMVAVTIIFLSLQTSSSKQTIIPSRWALLG
jgi:hypothetical protein